MLGTLRTLSAELQMNEVLDETWERAKDADWSWEDYKQLFINYIESRENDNDYTE